MRRTNYSEKLSNCNLVSYEHSSVSNENSGFSKKSKGKLSINNLQKKIPSKFECFTIEESDHSTKHSVCYTVNQKESEDSGSDCIKFFDNADASTKMLSNFETVIDHFLFDNVEKKNCFENKTKRKTSYENLSNKSATPEKICKTQDGRYESPKLKRPQQEESPIFNSSPMSLNSLEPEEIDQIDFEFNFISDDLTLRSACGLEDEISPEKEDRLGKRCIDDFMTNFNKISPTNPKKFAQDALTGLEMLESYCEKFVRIC